MTFLFIGGEDHDFTRIGTCSVDTATAAVRRTAYTRCALATGGSGVSDGWVGTLSTPSTSFWLTARSYNANSSYGYDYFSLTSGLVRRLVLITYYNGGVITLRLGKRDAAGTLTALATSSVAVSISTLIKIDVQVLNYGITGTVNLYQDGTLILSYTGDLTTDGSTTLDGFVLGCQYASQSQYFWSEVICSTTDTRSMSLCTLPSAANGNAYAWTNSYASINEVTIDDATLSLSAVAGDLLQTTITSSGLTGTPNILAVGLSARAQKGSTGPQNLQANVRTGGNDYFSSTLALPPAFNRVAAVFPTNPATAGAWAYTDLTAAGFNVGVKSIA